MPVCNCVFASSASAVPAGLTAAEGFCFSALETIRDGVCVFDSSWRCCYANAALLSLTGFGADEILGKPLDALLDAAPVDYLAGTAVSDDRELTCKDDSLVSVSVSMSSVTCGCHLAVFHLDAVFFRLNRALRMWQACSKTIVNADNEIRLLNEICELIVSRGGYRMAWVGLALHDSERTVQLVARAGVFDGYLDGVCLSWGDNEIGRGPSGTAIRTGQTQVTQDFSCNAQMRPWRVAALARGYQSNIALVLKSNTECYGALTIYADEPGVFTAQEVALLEEVAQDLGYCMMALRTRAEHRQAEAALAASEERYRSLFEHMVEGFAYCQMLYEDGRPVDFVYLNVNNAFERLSGLGPVEGKKISDVIPDLRFTSPELFEIYGRVAKSGEPERFEIYLERLKAWFTISVYSNQVGYFIAIFDNITERKESEARIQYLAHHDALTGLPNHLLGRNRFELARAYADRSDSKVALLFLDLDNFKTVNDSLGHTQGDGMLKSVARRLHESVRETDTLCRQGGDEFLVILTDLLDSDTIAFLSAKLLEQVCAPYHLGDIEVSTTASCGVAVYPDDGRDFDTLYKKADTAMYQAKDSGRNVCRFFDPQMNVDADERLSLRSSLRQALEHDEFVLYFQPQIDLRTRQVIGAEALIRWNHPKLGLVPPGRFIPVAEDSWLIVPIGEWVLREACREAASWRAPGIPDLVVAANLSAVQFRRGNLVQIVASALAESGLPPHLLELELTESILIKDTESVLETVNRLKALGVSLSIDDFGTGYSSLAYLQRFSVDKVKIDQSFIMDLVVNPGNVAIVQAIIQMAQSLGLRTIAEGVEVGWLLDYLAEHQCNEAQGYHIGMPMPARAFIEYVLRSRQ